MSLDRFEPHKTNTGGRRHQCKKCHYERIKKFRIENPERRRQQQKNWKSKNGEAIARYWEQFHRNNPGYMARYYQNRRQSILQSRPSIEKCHCGNVSDFRWLKDCWICRPCSRRAVARKEKVNCRRKYLFKKYGDLLVSVYDAYLSSSPHSKPSVSLLHLFKLCLPKDYQVLGKTGLEKIFFMNRISSKPHGNVGWNCLKCGLFSVEHRFFDLDHRTPRHKGGKGGKNLQILCPNCHREKTLIDLSRTPIGSSVQSPSFFESTSTARSPVDSGGP